MSFMKCHRTQERLKGFSDVQLRHYLFSSVLRSQEAYIIPIAQKSNSHFRNLDRDWCMRLSKSHARSDEHNCAFVCICFPCQMLGHQFNPFKNILCKGVV